MKLFSLEYIRQILNSNEIHFISAKKNTQFKIKNQIGPFICNNRNDGKEVDRCLQEIKFTSSFKWSYDPVGVISKLRVKLKLTPFIHESKPEIEKYSNQSEWLGNTLQEVDKQVDTSSIQDTLDPWDRNSKRVREEGSYTVEITSDTKFKLVSGKKTKLNPVIEHQKTVEAETQIIIKGDAPSTHVEETPLPSSSSAQIIQNQNNAEVSSSRKTMEKEKNTMERYKEIKIKNEALKAAICTQYCKQTPSDQSRLLSTFDLKTRKMQMIFLQPEVKGLITS